MLIHHPARLFPAPTLYTLSVLHLALQAFPPPVGSRPEKEPAQYTFFDQVETVVASPSKSAPQKAVRPGSRVFVEQSIRLGTKRQAFTRKGWVLKKGWLGYVLTRMPSGSYRVELVHLVSNWVMAMVFIDAIDETTHARVQGWVWDAHALTDWSRGIQAILKEKPGEQKKWAWTQHLETLWRQRQQELRQVSFF